MDAPERPCDPVQGASLPAPLAGCSVAPPGASLNAIGDFLNAPRLRPSGRPSRGRAARPGPAQKILPPTRGDPARCSAFAVTRPTTSLSPGSKEPGTISV